MVLKDAYWKIYRAAYTKTQISDETKAAIKELYHLEGREQLEEAAKKKKLVPAVAYLFESLGLDADYWKEITEKYRKRNQQVIEALDKMYSLLRENGIEKIAVVENFGALLASSSDICLFGSGDIDEYADPGEQPHIYDVLKKHNYELSEVYAGSKRISTSIVNKETMPEGFHFGINWDVTCRTNLPCFTSKGEFLDWKSCRYYKDTNIRLPSPESLMYVCLMHVAVHGFCKAPDIRLYFDIANAAENGLDWMKIEEMARRDDNCVKIAMAAYLSKKLLGVEVPDHIIGMGNIKQFNRLKKTVYQEENNILNDFPNILSRLLIEIYSNDHGAFSGIRSILFPEEDWIVKKYGSLAAGRIKHLLSLVHG